MSTARWLIPIARRSVQCLGLLVLVALPVFALYTHYAEARAIADLPDGWRNTTLQAIDGVVPDNEHARKLVMETQGTIWSAQIAGVSVTDPLAGAEAIVSSRSVYQPLLWSLLIPVAATMLLGRVFCGWVCPMNTLLEVVDKARRLLKLAEIRDRDVRFSLRNKYVLLGIVTCVLAITGVPFLAMIYPPAVMSREMHNYVFSGAVGLGAWLILAVCAIELFVSRRWWCRYVCPGGALYSLLGRFRLIRVKRDDRKCVGCGECVRVCQFAQKPMLVEFTGMECTNCGTCITHCNDDALKYQFVLPIVRSVPSNSDDSDKSCATKPPAIQKAPGRSAVVLFLAALIRQLPFVVFVAFLCVPQPAMAHHILGLPHYSYKENYPQAPTLEYPATTGPYDVLMTSYPGKAIPGEAATIAFYIKDRNTTEPYGQTVTMRVLQTFTFGESCVIHEPATHQPYDNQHKYTVTFPEDGEYIVELTMDVEGQTEVIPFLIVAGNPTATASIVACVVAGLLVFLITVRAIKVKRDRRLRDSPVDAPEDQGVPHNMGNESEAASRVLR